MVATEKVFLTEIAFVDAGIDFLEYCVKTAVQVSKSREPSQPQDICKQTNKTYFMTHPSEVCIPLKDRLITTTNAEHAI